VIQEAYLAGRPVVCSDIGGMAEKVQHGKSGLHFRMGDPLDLLQKLLELARSPKLYHELVEGIPPVFSDEAMSRWLHEFYQGLLQSKSPSIQVGAENHAA
jgi:glycosyltransferase involved in cell wall biosynthesis